MKLKVVRMHSISKDCFVCGVNNPAGLYTEFYELEDGSMAALVTARSIHQSYPERVHGGVITALLDETIGRAINVPEPDTWGVTAELTTRYKKPVPYDVPLIVISRLTANHRLYFAGEGSILLPDGEVAATATGKYLKQKLSQITDGFQEGDDSWSVFPASCPKEIEIPEKG